MEDISAQTTSDYRRIRMRSKMYQSI